MKTIYVGNLPGCATVDDIRALFSTIGETRSISLILDRNTGRSRGFGFVEMGNADAESAISRLDGQAFEGRPLRVSEAGDRMHRAAGGWR